MLFLSWKNILTCQQVFREKAIYFFVVNVILCLFQLCGLGVLGIGVWIRTDMVQFDELLGKSMVPIAAYILIAAGGVVLLISLVGCLGALKENRVLLGLVCI